MTNFFTIMTLFVVAAFASVETVQHQIAQLLYPSHLEDQAFTAKFFDIVELHKHNDPLLEGKGPSVASYSLDTIKFAFMTNETDSEVDLVFFNWTLPVFQGLVPWPELSNIYGSTVYVLQGVEKKLIATQGDNNDELSNFSYIFGAQYMETQIKKSNPDISVPPDLVDWKPHPDFMDKTHPLRKTLGTKVLTLLSPSKKIFFKQSGVTANTKDAYENYLNTIGGFKNVIMGMMVHEIYHLKEGEDGVNGLALDRDIPEDRKALVEQLQGDPSLRNLYATYSKIIFSIGDSLKNTTSSAEEIEKLKDLSVVISHIKANYNNAWLFIWDYEYTEGFAEYVSAYSMVQAEVTSLAQQIDLQKSDANNFAYRTGALGGLYHSTRLNIMPFKTNEDHRYSIWELVLQRVELPSSSSTLEEVQAKYMNDSFDVESEVGLVIDYLISTITEF